MSEDTRFYDPSDAEIECAELRRKIDTLTTRLAAAEEEGKAWRSLYRLAINEANGLTNYCEDRPGLRIAMKSIDAIAAQARDLAARAAQGGA